MAKEPKYLKAIKPLKELIVSGELLAVDPSSGSSSSMPGYAIFKAGILQESGTIEVVRDSAYFNKQLFGLGKCLREDFKIPDILVIEHIAPQFGGAGAGAFGMRNTHKLHQGVGAIMSCFDVPMVSIPPMVWRNIRPDNYVKTDENDAIMLGYAAIYKACELCQIDPVPPDNETLGKLCGGAPIKDDTNECEES